MFVVRYKSHKDEWHYYNGSRSTDTKNINHAKFFARKSDADRRAISWGYYKKPEVCEVELTITLKGTTP